MKKIENHHISMMALLALCFQLSGCFVSVHEDGFEDEYYYEEELAQGELIEEVFEEEVFEEESSTTTTTTTYEESGSVNDEPIVESRRIEPTKPIMIFEETFEKKAYLGAYN